MVNVTGMKCEAGGSTSRPRISARNCAEGLDLPVDATLTDDTTLKLCRLR